MISKPEYSVQISQILVAYRELSVPLNRCLPLIFKSLDIPIQQVTSEVGYTKDAFYKALRKTHKPKYPLHHSITKHLGVDPWAIYEAGEASDE